MLFILSFTLILVLVLRFLYISNQKYLSSMLKNSHLMKMGYSEYLQDKNYVEESSFNKFFLSNNFSKMYEKYIGSKSQKATYLFTLSLKVTSKDAGSFNALCYIVDSDLVSGVSLFVTPFENKIYFKESGEELLNVDKLNEKYKVVGDVSDKNILTDNIV